MKHVCIRTLSAWALMLVFGSAFAQEEMVELDPAHNDVADTASLQRGAKYFVNFCMGCHSAKYVRYNRLAEDLQIDDKDLEQNLMFTGDQPFDTMSIAMKPEDAKSWFGVAPPDLSLMARARGTDYIYTFLRSFYVDDSSATGVNNMVLPGTAMPDVLWQLQGVQKAMFEQEEGSEHEHFVGFDLAEPGQLTEAEFDGVVRDIVNFLDYIGEPIQLERQRLGTRVIGFLLILLLISYLLKREIWKDVH